MTGFSPTARQRPTHPFPDVDPRDAATLVLLGHDLRAALSDVIGGLRLVAPDTLDPLTRVQIERVRASAEVLARLLEQGLTVMLGEAEAAQTANLNLRRFLTDVDLRWSGRALETGVGFALHQAADLPPRLQIDRVALDRVLSNLLGNAFKYCERGRVVCEVAMRHDGWVGFVVSDDGPGFPLAILDRQTPFYSRPEGMTKPGSGMGLHIAADLTRRMGGRLTLGNLAAGGAEARVDLPVTGVDELDPEATEIEPILAGKRVLIADDNPTSQAILGHFATRLGAEIVVVGDGVETMGRLEREAFDLLIVDVEMPRLSGLDVIRCLRRMPGSVARMPVIAVTAYMMRSNRPAILAAGANDMLSKPLQCPQVFADVVRGVLPPQADPGPRGGTEGMVPGGLGVPGPDEPAALDETCLPRLLHLTGPETGRDLLDRLMSDLSGVERGLVQAGPLPDWDAIRTHSHVLISLAGAVGGQRMQAEAEALNQLAQRMYRHALAGQMHSVLTQLDAMIQFVTQVRDHHRLQTK